ncbi:MFS transporter [Acidicapsa acidisoli]|uniref:MFS transporter n=1 Tax=Acidicapsa acidisoli TaxID=1615681 RepID=UPI0021E0AB8B|nr:MFS transporter [Acidicapsa acidisoli]
MALDQKTSLETRVVRKISRRILPFVMLLYFVSFLDRVNVGFAAFSMNKAIGLTSAMFGFGGGIFFVSYFLFEVPSNLILYRVGARRWIARVMVSWGLVSATSAFATGPHSFYALRFLLGVAEAGFFPGIILYLSLWFPARHRAVAAAAFMAAAPLSTAIGSPISGALMQLPAFAGLNNWQWLYILEALPAILLGFVVLYFLTDSPEQARWLAPEERAWLVDTLQAERTGSDTHAAHTTGIWKTLSDPRILALSLVYLGTSAGLYTLGLWSPLILRQFGFSPLATGWLNSAPSFVAIAVMIAWARHSDRTLERTWHVVIPCVVACLGFVWAGTTHTAVGVILALMLVNIGISAAKAPLWAMPSAFLTGAEAAAGIALINSIGNLGGFAGPFLIGWLKDKSGSYAGGLYAVGAMLAVSAAVMLALSHQLRHRKS